MLKLIALLSIIQCTVLSGNVISLDEGDCIIISVKDIIYVLGDVIILKSRNHKSQSDYIYIIYITKSKMEILYVYTRKILYSLVQ